jgi:hypothetical protein
MYSFYRPIRNLNIDLKVRPMRIMAVYISSGAKTVLNVFAYTAIIILWLQYQLLCAFSNCNFTILKY